MILAIGLENGIEGRSLAYALDHPGCFAYGADGGDAIVTLPQAFLKYRDWIANHTRDSWLSELGDFDIRLVETWQTYFVDDQFETTDGEGKEVNAWFRHDWKPLSAQEIQRGLDLLAWSRADLLEAFSGLQDARLDEPHPGEKRTIRGILAHVATTEWWYLTRLNLANDLPRESLPKDPVERLQHVRSYLRQTLVQLAGSQQVTGVEGEIWSPRKLLRRVLWHELDHVGHIYKLQV
jgi:uncharacterized damage-inducible protein DinB